MFSVATRLQDVAEELIERNLTGDELLEILQMPGSELKRYAWDSSPESYHIAAADSALEYFIDNHRDYGDVA